MRREPSEGNFPFGSNIRIMKQEKMGREDKRWTERGWKRLKVSPDSFGGWRCGSDLVSSNSQFLSTALILPPDPPLSSSSGSGAEERVRELWTDSSVDCVYPSHQFTHLICQFYLILSINKIIFYYWCSFSLPPEDIVITIMRIMLWTRVRECQMKIWIYTWINW